MVFKINNNQLFINIMEIKSIKYIIIVISILILLINIFFEYNISTKIATSIIAVSLLLMILVNRKSKK